MSRNPILNWYDEWSNKTYFITRVTMITLVTSYLLSCFLDTDKFLKNSVYFTVIHYEVYRLISSPFCSNSILNVIISALFFLKMGITFESNLGSAAFFSMLGTLNLLVNFIFIAVCFLLYYICHMPGAIHFSCAGFWNILFAFLTVECFENPNHPRRLFMIPVDIPSKYFPVLIYAVWSLFSGPRLDWAISIAVGFMYQNGYFNYLKPNPQSLQNLESPTGVLHSISRSKGWILANVTIGHNEANRTGTEGGGSGSGLFWASQGGRGVSGTGEDSSHAGPFGGEGRMLGGATVFSPSRTRWFGGDKGTLSSSSQPPAIEEKGVVIERNIAAVSHRTQEEHIETDRLPEDDIEGNLKRSEINERKRALIAKAVEKRIPNFSCPVAPPNESTSLLNAAGNKLGSI